MNYRVTAVFPDVLVLWAERTSNDKQTTNINTTRHESLTCVEKLTCGKLSPPNVTGKYIKKLKHESILTLEIRSMERGICPIAVQLCAIFIVSFNFWLIRSIVFLAIFPHSRVWNRFLIGLRFFSNRFSIIRTGTELSRHCSFSWRSCLVSGADFQR